MAQPLSNHANDDGDLGGADTVSTSTMTTPGATATAVKVWKPVIIRVVLGGLALFGLAGVGAASMLAGLDGARANPPATSAVRAGVSAAPSAAGSAQAQVPAAADGAQAAPNTGAALPGACNAGRTADGKVILNQATMDDLRTLPNIGQKRAQAILNLRDKLKKFHRIQELRRVRGIGAKTLLKLTPKLLVDPPKDMCAAAAAPPTAPAQTHVPPSGS